jgi:hypothetical protein
MISMDNLHTLIFGEHELIALSAAILTIPHSERGLDLENARCKVRDSLDGRIANNYEDEYGRIPRG